MKPGPGGFSPRPPLRFRPPWWAVLLAAIGCAAGIALGNWQTGRAAEKRALAATLVQVTLHGGGRGALLLGPARLPEAERDARGAARGGERYAPPGRAEAQPQPWRKTAGAGLHGSR